MIWPLQISSPEIERLRAMNEASKADVQYYEAKNAELREQIAKLRAALVEIAEMDEAYRMPDPFATTQHIARAVLEETK